MMDNYLGLILTALPVAVLMIGSVIYAQHVVREEEREHKGRRP